MPLAADNKPCLFPRCPAIVSGRDYCPVHTPLAVLARCITIVEKMTVPLAMGEVETANMKTYRDHLVEALKSTV